MVFDEWKTVGLGEVLQGRSGRTGRRNGPALLAPLTTARAAKPHAKKEGTSLPGRTLYPDAPAHGFDQLLRDRKAQARPAVFATQRGVQLTKAAKQLLLLCLGNANPRIAHRKFQLYVVAPGHEAAGHFDLALLGKLERIADEVEEHLLQPPLVPYEARRDRRVLPAMQRDFFLPGQRSKELFGLLQNALRRKGLLLQLRTNRPGEILRGTVKGLFLQPAR